MINLINGPKVAVVICSCLELRPWEIKYCKAVIDSWMFNNLEVILAVSGRSLFSHDHIAHNRYHTVIWTTQNRGQHLGEQDNINAGIACAYLNKFDVVLKVNADTWFLDNKKVQKLIQDFWQAADKWYWGFDHWGPATCSTDVFLIKPKQVFDMKIFPLCMHEYTFEGEFWQHFSAKSCVDRMIIVKGQRERSFSREWSFVAYHDLQDNFKKAKELGFDAIVEVLKTL